MHTEAKFEIDFFEFAFLVEACIPPVPIARHMFFERVSSFYYDIMSEAERIHLFEWIQKSSRFDLENEECRHFFARFNPDNQYVVYTEHNGKKESTQVYRFNDQYHINRNTSVLEKHIYRVERLEHSAQ